MAKQKDKPSGTVDATPVKSFFVHMLTRDIRLEDAILDLLDNCVDGALRSKAGQPPTHGKGPLSGFWAEIKFEKDSFMIRDNCGGIPWSLHDYAFRMGKLPGSPTDAPGGVGAYGIGMKRAIFKMGKQCLISTRSGETAYDVEISPKWTENENSWRIPVSASRQPPRDRGTTILVGDLFEGIASRFSDDAEALKSDLERTVATQYAYIIDKGFRVKINGDEVRPRPTRIIFEKRQRGADGPAILPYLFRASVDGVDIFLTVGLTRPIPTPDEISDEQEQKKYSSLDAGWTVLCNDRAVLYCDRTEMTGWGEAGVPRYHTQFIAISGIVEFRASDASKLPTTTTKRGVDGSSRLYLQVKNKMREGMRIFTDYTNRWKARPEDSRKQVERGEPLSFDEIKAEAEKLALTALRTAPQGGKAEQFKPDLPMPRNVSPKERRISFVRKASEVEAVGEYLLGDPAAQPSQVGEKCFDLMLRDARK